jgi:hypothetical protein
MVKYLIRRVLGEKMEFFAILYIYFLFSLVNKITEVEEYKQSKTEYLLKPHFYRNRPLNLSNFKYFLFFIAIVCPLELILALSWPLPTLHEPPTSHGS